jgi:oxygen-dependent protoporphyrinogen oxidase
MRIAVIGGGIAGLSAAWELEKARKEGAALEYVLFEASPVLGGSLRSEKVEGCVFEAGPDSFLSEKPAAAELCKELGIADQLLPSGDQQRKTYILRRNRLVALPDGLMFMVPTKLIPTALSPLFSLRTKIRMGLELLHPPRPSEQEESVAQLIERHFGAELVDRLADPLLSGIYGGDCSKLSAESVLPMMVKMEREYGSLTRGMLAAHAKMKKAMAGKAKSAPRPLFTTLCSGMQTMSTAIERTLLPASIRCSTAVLSLKPSESNWMVETATGVESFDAVILASQSWAAGRMLRSTNAALAANLEAIPYASSITVNLLYDAKEFGKVPPGFGFLIPASEKRQMMACTFVQQKFPGRIPDGKVLLRCFLGTSRNESLKSRSDLELEFIVRDELESILGLRATPIATRVYRWSGAMAQYTVGHKSRIAAIRKEVEQMPGLELVGNGYDGIGVPDCIRTGRAAAKAVMALSVQQDAISTR